MEKKLIFAVVGVIVAAELIWAGWTLTQNSPPVRSHVAIPNQTGVGSTISLKAFKNEFKVGEDIPVTIELSSSKATDGTDVILSYDPKVASVVVGLTKAPVVLGTIYNDYPLNKVDESAGRVSVSGITSQANGVVTRGILGTVTFKAKAKGSTVISVDFTPGSTVDSNIIETKLAKDILTGVNNLEINITP